MKKTLTMAAALAGLFTLSHSPADARAEGWKQQGDWLVRGRAIAIVPDEGQDINVIGGDADLGNAIVPELDFSYFVTDNIALELILATAEHSVNLENSTLGDLDLGEIWILPPTLTLQYHFDPLTNYGISPYVGAGINYTFFYNGDTDDNPVTDVDYDDGFGYALQAGVDVPISGNWFANLDVKKIWLNTDLTVQAGATVTGDVDLDPWIFGAGVGYRF
ncbi:MAG: OmpW family protein [Alphaproteobacteria bacterium]|nr:OmpW family protein [Alphaproteobacteria bacterium]